MTYSEVRIGPGVYVNCCEDCGAVVVDGHAHARFHDILNDQATAIALLLTSHLAASLHDRYDVCERVSERVKGNNWSTEAFAEITGVISQDTPKETE